MRHLFLCALCLLLASCYGKEQKIVIVSTNDIHAQLDNLPRLATLVERQRAAHPGRVILLDAGDRWTGSPYVDMAPEIGAPIIELLDSLHYDAATLGNHAFDFGQGVLAARMGEMNFPLVLANIHANGEIPQPAPYLFIEVGGVKFALLGLLNTLNGGYPAGLPEHFGAMHFDEPQARALEYRSLADSAEVFVLLSHLGYEADTLLAHQMPELDLIVGGHTHTALPTGHRVGNTLVTQTGGRLKQAGVTTLTLRRGKLVEAENHLVALDTIAPDPRFEAMVARIKNRPELLRPVARLTGGLGKIGLVNLAADVIRSYVQADLAIYNRGGVRLDTLPAGDVRVVDIYSMEPFGNTIQTLDMTLDDLKAFLLSSYNDPAGEFVMPSGFTYTLTIDSATQKATDISIRLVGKPTPSGRYRVAAPDYVFKNFAFDGRGRGTESGVRIASAMEAFLDKRGEYTGDNTPRVEIK